MRMMGFMMRSRDQAGCAKIPGGLFLTKSRGADLHRLYLAKSLAAVTAKLHTWLRMPHCFLLTSGVQAGMPAGGNVFTAIQTCHT
jgi:hypothetical protein